MRVNTTLKKIEDFFLHLKLDQKKTDGGFENFSGDPTNLALLGLVVTVGTTIIQMFRGN